MLVHNLREGRRMWGVGGAGRRIENEKMQKETKVLSSPKITSGDKAMTKNNINKRAIQIKHGESVVRWYTKD